jgi:hypothetical protein
LNTSLLNVRRALCPASPAELLPDNDRLDDRTERVFTDPTPWDGLTSLDLELIAAQIAKAVKA